MRYEVTSTGRLVRRSDTDITAAVEAADLEAFVDLFARELEKIDAEDIDISTNLKSCDVSISITLEAEDLPSAQVIGGSTIRTAFHAAGAATPEWSIDWVSAEVVPEDDSESSDDDDDLVDA